MAGPHHQHLQPPSWASNWDINKAALLHHSAPHVTTDLTIWILNAFSLVIYAHIYFKNYIMKVCNLLWLACHSGYFNVSFTLSNYFSSFLFPLTCQSRWLRPSRDKVRSSFHLTGDFFLAAVTLHCSGGTSLCLLWDALGCDFVCLDSSRVVFFFTVCTADLLHLSRISNPLRLFFFFCKPRPL